MRLALDAHQSRQSVFFCGAGDYPKVPKNGFYNHVQDE
jgi:hypothetical protein